MAVGKRFLSKASLAAIVAIALIASAALGSLSVGADESPSRQLRVAIMQDMPDFNIFNLASNSVWKKDVLRWAFEGLAAVDSDHMPYPLLAQSWSFEESTLTLDIQLRQGVLFHNGSEMTADDVVFTYQVIRAGTVYSSSLVPAFDSDSDGQLSDSEMAMAVSKVDTYSVRMQLANPYANFFADTLTVPIIPRCIWQYHLNSYGLVDFLWNDPAATTATGPFYYKEGAQGSYRVMQKFPYYWGEGMSTPCGYDLSPQNIDQLYFKVVGDIDSAVSELLAGSLDCCSWALPADKAEALEGDPRVSIHELADNGYFYLAFNMKQEPMNSLQFRKAVSYLIDKEKIADVFAEDNAEAAEFCLPPYWGEWVSDSPDPYPYDPSLVSSFEALDEGGFVDIDGDGWRDMPDGSPMETIVIQTPPRDYDPVRYRAGEMIAFRMLEVGIKATVDDPDFSVVVANLQEMNYQMLVIGWALGNDPIGNVFDILGPMASTNTFGFWPEDDPNPFYSDVGPVSTLADAETQDLAREIMVLEEMTRSTMVTAEQMAHVSMAQDLIAEAIPVEVLYCREDSFATGATWDGWIPFKGSLLNSFSLADLVEVNTDRTFVPPVAPLNVGVTCPTTVVIGVPMLGSYVVTDGYGNLSQDPDSVMVTITYVSNSGDSSVFYYDKAGAAQGFFNPEQDCPYPEGYGSVTVTATTMYGASASDGTAFRFVSAVPRTLIVSAEADAPILEPGESTNIMIRVEDETGAPVEGASVALDTDLIDGGTVDAGAVATDASGQAQIVYTAPSDMDLRNSHLPVTLLLNVTLTVNESLPFYRWTGSCSCDLLVMNNDPPDWAMVMIDSVSTTALSPSQNSTTIDVQVVDAFGSRLPNIPLTVEYGSDEIVFEPTASIQTNGAGMATLDVQLREGIGSQALRVSLVPQYGPKSVPASVTLTYLDEAPPESEMYGGYVVYSSQQFVDPMGSLGIAVHVWDSLGNPANVNASVVLSGTPYGSLAWSDDMNWDSVYDYLGVNIRTDGDDQNTVTSGPFNTLFDEENYWEWKDWWLFWEWGMMTGVDIIDGILSIDMYAVDVAPADLLASIHVVPDGFGWFNSTSFSYQIDGATTISGDYVLGRSYSAVAPSISIDDPALMAKSSDCESTAVTVSVKNEVGLPVEGAEVLVYEDLLRGNTNYYIEPYLDIYRRWSAPVPTDVEGCAEVTLTALGYRDVVASSTSMPQVYAKASYPGSISMLSQMEVIIYVQPTAIHTVPIMAPVEVDQTVTIMANVSGPTGGLVAGMVVNGVAGAGNLIEMSGVTDSYGMVALAFHLGNVSGVIGGFAPVLLWTGAAPYGASSARMMIPVGNAAPFVAVGEPYNGQVITQPLVRVRGYAYDGSGLASVAISMDGTTVLTIPVPNNEHSLFFDKYLDVTSGTHTLKVTATDVYGLSSEVSRWFTVLIPLPEYTVSRNRSSPTSEAVSWIYQPHENGLWSASVENYGLNAVLIEVYEISLPENVLLLSQKISLRPQDAPANTTIVSDSVPMLAEHAYRIIVTPYGAPGTYAVIQPEFDAY